MNIVLREQCAGFCWHLRWSIWWGPKLVGKKESDVWVLVWPSQWEDVCGMIPGRALTTTNPSASIAWLLQILPWTFSVFCHVILELVKLAIICFCNLFLLEIPEQSYGGFTAALRESLVNALFLTLILECAAATGFSLCLQEPSQIWLSWITNTVHSNWFVCLSMWESSHADELPPLVDVKPLWETIV